MIRDWLDENEVNILHFVGHGGTTRLFTTVSCTSPTRTGGARGFGRPVWARPLEPMTPCGWWY